MTPEQQAAYINAQTVCALAEIAGMVAKNIRARSGSCWRTGWYREKEQRDEQAKFDNGKTSSGNAVLFAV